MTARAYAARRRQPLDANRDLLGLSAANTTAALTGTFVVNGSPTQTAMVETWRQQPARPSLDCGSRNAGVALPDGTPAIPTRLRPGAIVFTIAVHLVDVRGLRDLSASPVEWRTWPW